MRRALPLALAAAAAVAGPTRAQDAPPVYQTQPKQSFRFAGDSLARYEWTREIPDGTGGTTNEDRYRVQARPRVELRLGPFEAGVGGAFEYGEDENDLAPDGGTPAIIRDNYRSRDARLDLAWGKLTIGPVVAQGGRFLMPLPLTEMIWDRDLRPQGGALGLEFGGSGSPTRVALTGIYATGSHVFEDESVMYGGGLELSFGSTGGSSFQLAGSYLQFEDLSLLEPAIRRQNTRVAGLIVSDYQVVDVLARYTSGAVTLVGDYCWNVALDADNRGLWLAAILGSLDVSRARLEYTYAKIDKDATVAAFNTDDFFWNTGWEGHRLDLATATGKGGSIHLVGQVQRFKDSPNELVRDEWVQRYRVEWRKTF